MSDVTSSSQADMPKQPPSPLQAFWASFSENRGAVIGVSLIILIFLCAVLADLIAPFAPDTQYRDAFLLPPMWFEGGDPRFILGTDAIGRDLLSRLIHGSRYSLLIGLVVVGLSLTTGVIIGLTAGFYGGRVDALIMRFMDIIMAFPNLLLALVMVALLGPGLMNAMIAIALVLQPHFVRLTRASVLSERQKPYVSASQLAGAGPLRLMLIVILPNCLAPLIVQATLSFSTAILDAAALGFLGMGAQPPTPEWGTLLAESREFITRAPWVVTIPGLTILVTVLSFNLMGDGLRDALDPKMRRS